MTAIALMNSNVWMLSDRLSPLRMAVAVLLSIAIMVGWLIVRYGLWEPAEAEQLHDTEVKSDGKVSETEAPMTSDGPPLVTTIV